MKNAIKKSLIIAGVVLLCLLAFSLKTPQALALPCTNGDMQTRTPAGNCTAGQDEGIQYRANGAWSDCYKYCTETYSGYPGARECDNSTGTWEWGECMFPCLHDCYLELVLLDPASTDLSDLLEACPFLITQI